MKTIGICLLLVVYFYPALTTAQCIKGDCNNGEGTFASPDGTIYVGHWTDGRHGGQGSLFLPDGTILTGTFENGELIAASEQQEKKPASKPKTIKKTKPVNTSQPPPPPPSVSGPAPSAGTTPLLLEGTPKKIKKITKTKKTVRQPKPGIPTKKGALPGRYPEASNRLLTDSDLNGKGLWELKIMRNEIFARHSYIFKTPLMVIYFGKQKWYSPKYPDIFMQLSDIEKENIKLIRKYEGRTAP